MTREDNIIVPLWFLKNVENTLRIQNNINLDKETGETCQDRNVRESLNGLCKLLKGEELTGLERLEKLQPSIPSDLDEAVDDMRDDAAYDWVMSNFGNPKESLFDFDCRCFKAGAEWMAGQGQTFEAHVDNGCAIASGVELPFVLWDTYEDGEVLKVQIRKK